MNKGLKKLLILTFATGLFTSQETSAGIFDGLFSIFGCSTKKEDAAEKLKRYENVDCSKVAEKFSAAHFLGIPFVERAAESGNIEMEVLLRCLKKSTATYKFSKEESNRLKNSVHEAFPEFSSKLNKRRLLRKTNHENVDCSEILKNASLIHLLSIGYVEKYLEQNKKDKKMKLFAHCLNKAQEQQAKYISNSFNADITAQVNRSEFQKFFRQFKEQKSDI